MILAAPLVIPFAKAVGLSVGTLGMAALADQVNDYIQANPEESMKILSTIIPNVGIGQIFMSKEDKISLEDLEDMTDEEAQDLSKEEKAELMKQAGKRRNRELSIATSEKIGLSGPGKEKQDIEYEIDERYDEGGVEQKKAPFDYTKFFRRRRADGGAIGIEVLFEEKKPRKDFNTGGRATTQDFARALKSVSAGTTYQQQRQARDYARQEASNLLSQAMRSGNQGNIQSILQGIGGRGTIPGLQFSMSGNRITGVPATGAGRDAIINAMANRMLNTTSYGTMSGGSSAPMKKSPLQLKIEENQRIYDEYIKNNPPAIGIITGPQGGAPTPPKPEYEDQALLSKLTMLTPEEALAGETFDMLSDLDQYNFAQAFTQFQPQLRDPTYVSPYGLDPRQTFRRRYGIKDGGRVGFDLGGLTGPAKSIYDSMMAAGYFTEDEIRNAIINAGYEIPGTTTTTTPVTNVTPNIINQGGDGDGGSPPPGPTDPYAGLGYSSANFGLGKETIGDFVNKDAVMDYEADAYEIGRTPLGQLSRFGIGIVNALKNLPTPFNLARKAIEFAKQKELEKKAREEAIARDLARSIQEQNIANRTGGYGFGYSPTSDFMSGGAQGKGGFDNTEAGIGAASAAMGSSKDGGLMGYGGKSGTPRGVASMFVEKR